MSLFSEFTSGELLYTHKNNFHTGLQCKRFNHQTVSHAASLTADWSEISQHTQHKY